MNADTAEALDNASARIGQERPLWAQGEPAPYACRPELSRGRLIDEPESLTRSPFQRDRDRIIHSAAFRKLKYKTQVFVYHEGDYYRTRLTHTIEVGQITRTLCRVLGLNEDLAEAVALAHDLGHTPFGHAGEDALDPCMADFGGFSHNDQTLRVVTRLEQRYAAFDGLNLTWETVEGVAKHNGPLLPLPEGGRLHVTTAALNASWDLELDSWPSAEAQVAALSDDIAYNNHDIDDGLRAGLIGLDDLRDLPVVGDIVDGIERAHPGLQIGRLIHETTRRLIGAMVEDVLAETARRLQESRIDHVDGVRGAGRATVAFSPPMFEAVQALRRFLMARVYRHYRVNRTTSKARRVVRQMFELLFREPELLPPEWQGAFADETDKARAIADYIAGMTDRYALIEHQRLFDPYEKG